MGKSKVNATVRLEIGKLYEDGVKIRDIAKRMGIGERTVGTYIKDLIDEGVMQRRSKVESAQIEKRITGNLASKEEYERLKAFVIKRKTVRIGELSRLIDRSKETVIKHLDSLGREGIKINIEKGQAVIESINRSTSPISIPNLYKRTVKVGFVSDTHIGSIAQQLTLLHSAYKEFEREGVNFVIHAGDVFDGEHVYRNQEREIFLYGIDKAEDYFLKNYPKTDKFKTYMIAGNHDEDFYRRTGHNIVKEVCSKRKELVYTDRFQTFTVKNTSFKVIHPKGGGAYAKSYKLQKHFQALLQDVIINMRNEKETEIPHAYITGHFHYYVEFDYADITGLSLPCFQGQTPHLLDLGLNPEIGCIIIEYKFDANNNIIDMLTRRIRMTHLMKKNDY